ncbi:phosphomannomutase/phosphoglucomutase [Patescibacteria group bacterium]|nr:phosphomannomutase/phosphoglucomutase [Patescibacteria group bacterium]
MINSNIFKAYDIRGVYPDEINEDAVYKIGLAFLEFLSKKGGLNNQQIIIGRDMRLSSDDLFDALAQALVSQSFDVIDIGRISTSFFYWALISQKAAGGIMITASHNPAQYNGLKLYGEGGFPIGATSGLEEIRELALKDKTISIATALGRIQEKNLWPEYTEFIKSKVDLSRIKPLKIIADCGNGMMGPEIKKIIGDLPVEIEILFGEPDGSFPNHEADPVKEENLIDLKKAIKTKGADLGVAFDGDGDRICFIDEAGESVRGDFITALIAQDLLKKSPGQKIFYETRSSRAVPEAIKAAGGVAVLGRAGHTLIKTQMRQEDILFGGELSGHYFYRDLGFVENSFITMLKVWEILSSQQQLFSVLCAPLKKYFNSGEINFKVADADKTLAGIELHFSGAPIKKIDGLTVEYPDWWFNLRKSNTEPLVRLNLEANSASLLEEKKREVIGLIE